MATINLFAVRTASSGGGLFEFDGDNPAVQLNVWGPVAEIESIAWEKNGSNLYISTNNDFYELDGTNLNVILNTWPASNNQVTGMSWHPTLNHLYAIDRLNDKIQRRDGANPVSVLASWTTQADGFGNRSPFGIGWDPSGDHFFYTDDAADRIWKNDGASPGIELESWGAAGSVTGIDVHPTGGNPYSTESAVIAKIRKHDPDNLSVVLQQWTAPQGSLRDLSWEKPNDAPFPTALETEEKTNPVSVSDFTPEFTAVFSDPDANDFSTAIQWQVATDSGFTSLVWDSGEVETAVLTDGQRTLPMTYAGQTLNADATYYLRARFKYKRILSTSDPSVWSAWSDGSDIFTMIKSPSPPTSIQSDGESNPNNLLSDPSFSAVFEDEDVGDTATKIQIKVGDSPGGSNLWSSAWIGLSAPLAIGSRSEEIAYDGSPLSVDTTYYVSIRFEDEHGLQGAWSDGNDTFMLLDLQDAFLDEVIFPGGGTKTFRLKVVHNTISGDLYKFEVDRQDGNGFVLLVDDHPNQTYDDTGLAEDRTDFIYRAYVKRDGVTSAASEFNSWVTADPIDFEHRLWEKTSQMATYRHAILTSVQTRDTQIFNHRMFGRAQDQKLFSHRLFEQVHDETEFQHQLIGVKKPVNAIYEAG